ncbi:MAG TPA: hypothetical protein VJS19_04380 [Candidatus Dormibacteraeota bacterium]|nr:hypothetical protein [Candidatus Dormibacteraeota bacterium]
MKFSRPRVVAFAILVPVAFIVLGAAAFAVISLQPRGNPSGQSSQNPNERCAPSPCGAPAGFEVDVTSVEAQSNQLVLTVVFRNHTQPQMFEAVSYRHTSPADFTLRAGGRTLRPVFSADCPNWPEVDVNRGATSAPRQLCFAVTSPAGTSLVWDPDLGVIPEPVSIALG